MIYLEDNYATRYADYDINSPESVIGLTIMQEEFLDQSVAVAKAIQDNFAKKLRRKDRKVKQAGFIVLHQTFMPSVLIEAGFLTNDREGAYLNSAKGQFEMGTAIAEAIVSYKQNALASVGQGSVSSMPSAPDPEDAVAESASEEGGMDNSVVDIDTTIAEASKEPPMQENKPPTDTNQDVADMLEQAEKAAVESITKNDGVEKPREVDATPVAQEEIPGKRQR